MLTRRDIIIKWLNFAIVSLALLLLHMLLLHNCKPFGVSTFLPPLLVGVVASLEDTSAGTIYGMCMGFLCDLTIAGTFPCVYTLAFTAAALCCSLLAKSVLQRGFFCSLAVSALTFLFVDALNMLALWFKSGAAFAPMALLALRETLVSCVLLFVCHPVLLWLHLKFTL